jgi:broad specificity phosphatase PhoE
VLSLRLSVEVRTVGVLSLFSDKPTAFDASSEVAGELFATHASMALGGVRREQQFNLVVRPRDVIGQAKGVLMAQHGLDEQIAFATLVQYSQNTHQTRACDTLFAMNGEVRAGKARCMTGWPEALWLVRHGESEGNVADVAARKAGAARLDLDVNDIDVELSPLGEDQARALGDRLAQLSEAERPTAVVVSPYRRARQTTDIALAAAGLQDLPTTVDERLRDREQGILDRLTATGIRDRFPEEAERRRYVGKFWYRPPGGESWADVAQRVRAALTDLRLDHDGDRVLLVAHDVPILLARYVLEHLDVGDVLSLAGVIGNCSLSTYAAADHGLRLMCFNDTSHIEAHEEATVTAHE